MKESIFSRNILSAIVLMLGISGSFAQTSSDIKEVTPLVVFDIPQSFDPEMSLNTDPRTGLTPYNLYTDPKYQGDILHKAFSDFTGDGYITFNYSLTDLHDVEGTVYYPLWLLGFEDNGGNITFHFSNEYISDYGVNISKVVIRDAQNRFSKDGIEVTVNGKTQTLPYTPNSRNIPQGDDTLSTSINLEFDFADSTPVESVAISCKDYGMGFSSIEFYTGQQQSSQVETISGEQHITTYDLTGNRISHATSGIVIDVTPDGKARKVVRSTR
ncbi:MAG: hypothetical protein K2H86_08525 [Muribaculaceae bacterium]|nr:hypothetical protein [Muribaculaceae bacterium]